MTSLSELARKIFLARSLFLSPRVWWTDTLCFLPALLFPRLFTLFLIFLSPILLPGADRVHLLKQLFAKRSTAPSLKDASEYWLFSPALHMREKTFVRGFSSKITRVVLLGDTPDDYYRAHGLQTDRLRRDWLSVWLYILAHADGKRLFVMSGMSDWYFLPLKLHPLHDRIAYDAYDPIDEYFIHPMLILFGHLNYRLGHFYIVRDTRFVQALRRAGNSAERCPVPDAPQFEMMKTQKILEKFAPDKPLRFISAGAVTAEGDGGILRSLQLVRKIWPEAEIHLCLSQFMPVDDPRFAPLVAFLEKDPKGYTHINLQGSAYQDMLDSAQIGLNLHDRGVFNEPYRDFSYSMVRRSPSARVLDFAARGCILMTAKPQRFSTRMFRRASPHGIVTYLSPDMKAESLEQVFAQVHAKLRDRL